MAFQGTLETFNLADVFQNLAQNSQTGTLHLNREDGDQRYLYFQSGKLKYLSKGKGVGILRDGMFVARQVCHPTEVQQAQQMARNSSKSIAQCLVSLGVANEAAIGKVIRFYIEEETYDLFLWAKASFEFDERPPEDGLFDDQKFGEYDPLDVAALIMEAARRIDEWERLVKHIGSMKEIFVFEDSLKDAARGGEFDLTQTEQIVMATMNAGRDLDDIVATTYLSPFEVATAAAGFVQAGMGRKATTEELKRAVSEAELVGDTGRCLKLYERVLSANSEDAEIRYKLAKLLPQVERIDDALVHYGILGDAAWHDHRDAEAVEIFNAIIELDASHILAHTRLIELMNRLHQEEKAGEYAFKLAGILTNQDRIDEAIEAIEKAVETDIRNIEYRTELVKLLLSVNEKARAARELEMIGDVLHKVGKSRAAADTYKRAMTLDRNLTHLKGKLQNVLLSEDEKQRRKTQVILIVSGVILLLALLGGGLWYYVNEKKLIMKEYDSLQTVGEASPDGIEKTDTMAKIRAKTEKIERTMKELKDDVDRLPTSISIDIQTDNPRQQVEQESEKIVRDWKALKRRIAESENDVNAFKEEIDILKSRLEKLKRSINRHVFSVIGIAADSAKDTEKDINEINGLKNKTDNEQIILFNRRDEKEEKYYNMMQTFSYRDPSILQQYHLWLYALIVRDINERDSTRRIEAERIIEGIERRIDEDASVIEWIKTHNTLDYWTRIEQLLQSSSAGAIDDAIRELRDDNNKKLDYYKKYYDTSVQNQIAISLGVVVHSDVPGGTVYINGRSAGRVGVLREGQGVLLKYNPIEPGNKVEWEYRDAKRGEAKSVALRDAGIANLFTLPHTLAVAPSYEPEVHQPLDARPVTPIIVINDIFYIGIQDGTVLCFDPIKSITRKIELMPEDKSLEICFPPTWDEEKARLYWPLHNRNNTSALVVFTPERTDAMGQIATSGGQPLRQTYDMGVGKYAVPLTVDSSRYLTGRVGLMATDRRVALISLEHLRTPLNMTWSTNIGFQPTQPPISVKYQRPDNPRSDDYMITPSIGKLYMNDLQRQLNSQGSIDIPGAMLSEVATPLIPVAIHGFPEPLYIFGVQNPETPLYMANFIDPIDKNKIMPVAGVRFRGSLLKHYYQKSNQLFFCTTTHIYGVKVTNAGSAIIEQTVDMDGKEVSGAPVIQGNVLYAGTIDGEVSAYNLRIDSAGEFRWKAKIPGGSAILGSPVIADRKVWFLTEDGNLFGYRSTR